APRLNHPATASRSAEASASIDSAGSAVTFRRRVHVTHPQLSRDTAFAWAAVRRPSNRPSKSGDEGGAMPLINSYVYAEDYCAAGLSPPATRERLQASLDAAAGKTWVAPPYDVTVDAALLPHSHTRLVTATPGAAIRVCPGGWFVYTEGG